VEGYNLRSERELERLAIHAAWIINSQRSKKQKPVTVKRLLGKEKGPMSQEDKQREFEKLKNLLRKKGGP
ncbi:hypothetical protein, partial [Corallococcus carmarthensis]|uniref:hypothetical protein n=1 Tax=Corallococcus carmarthensis TaxID=2316728 RepID=UPI001C122F13